MTVHYQSAGNGARSPSAKWLTKKMGLSLSSECQYWGGGRGLWRQTVPRPRGSHEKRTVTEGGPTSWRWTERRRRRATISDVSRRLSVRYAGALPSGVNLAGILGGRRPDPEGLSQTARCGVWGGGTPSPEKKEFFDLKWCVLVNSERYFCPFPRQKNVEFSAWSGDLVDVEDVLLGIIGSE